MTNTIFMQLLFLLLSLSAFTTSLTAHASDSQALSTLLQGYQVVSGDFEQTLVDDQGQALQDPSSGAFIVKKPGYFRWETQEPFPQLIISNLERIWLYDPDLEQVTVRTYSENIDQSPAILLSGNAQMIADNYSVKRISDKPQTFSLTPLTEGSQFTELQLSFDQQVLSQMILKDSLQQVTTFRFSELVIDQAIPNSAFEFEAPEGVDVIINE